jgi:hypothetical protein
LRFAGVPQRPCHVAGGVAVILNALTCPATKSFLSTRLVLYIGRVSFAVSFKFGFFTFFFYATFGCISLQKCQPCRFSPFTCCSTSLPLTCVSYERCCRIADDSRQVYLLHYIVLVLFDHWLFGGSGVSGDRPAVVGSMLLLLIPLMLLIAYPFFMYVALPLFPQQKLSIRYFQLSCPLPFPICISCPCTSHRYIDAPSVKLARIFCDLVLRKTQVTLPLSSALHWFHFFNSFIATPGCLDSTRPPLVHWNGSVSGCDRDCWSYSSSWRIRKRV